MKLYIDDIRDAPDDSWELARTVEEAIRVLALMGSHIREISLDHDIENRPETFQPVAYFIGEKFWVDKSLTKGLRLGRLSNPPKITLHTMNPAGAEEMKAILKTYGLESEIKPCSTELAEFYKKYGVDQ